MPASRSSASSFVERDRLVGHVAAGHDERHADVGQQQVVQRRVGEHHAELARARRDATARRGASARRGAMTIGRARRGERAVVRCASSTSASRSASRDHQRERPVLAVLAGPQPRDRGLVVGAAREVEAADALDGDDRRRRAARVSRRRP